MPKIVLTNFKTMTGDWAPAIDEASFYRRIVGFFPVVRKFLLTADSKYTETPNPLSISPETENVSGSALNGYPAAFIASPTLGKVLVVTNEFYVYALDNTTTSLGQPVAGSYSMESDIIIYQNKVVTFATTRNDAEYGNISATPSWTMFGTFNTPRFMETMLDKLYVVHSSVSSTADRRLVRIVNSSFVDSNGLDLGAGWFIKAITNVDNQFLAIPATQENASEAAAEKGTLFIWNGLASNSYTYSPNFTGVYQGSAVKDGSYFLFVKQGLSLVCLIYTNGRLIEIARKDNISPLTSITNSRNRVQVAGDYFVIPTSSGVLFWNVFTGESFFGYDNATTIKAVLTTMQAATGGWRFYFGDGSSTNLKKWVVDGTGTAYMTGSIGETNFLPFTDEQGHPIRAQVKELRVYYKTKPPSTSDQFAFVFTYRDDIEGTATTYTPAVINSANSHTRMAKIENIGLVCDKLSLKLTTTVATTSWNPIVDRIEIDWIPVNTSN